MAQFDEIWNKHEQLDRHFSGDQYLNANFKEVWDKTKVFEGGYQAMPQDPANYCPAKGKPGSQLIGTKYGISAISLAHHIKRCPSVSEVKNLTPEKAREVAKKQYWDPIQGDKINSQAVAHLIFDITYGGAAGPLQVRQSINAIKGKDTVKEYKSFNLNDNEIKLVNSIPEKQIFSEIYRRRLNFYKGHTYEAGLTSRLNKLKDMYLQGYDVTAKFAKRHYGKIILVAGVIGVGLYFLLTKKKH